jgi:subtilase family serine protease
MSPALAIGPQAAAVDATVSAAAGQPSYRLRTCQVQNYPGRVGSCYDPYQMRQAYGVSPLIAAGYDGTGKSIDIIDAYNISTLNIDVNGFDSYYGLPGTPADQTARPTFLHVYTPEGAVANDDNNWGGEIDLDVQWAHAIAPGATINLIEAKSNNDIDLSNALRWALDHKVGDVVSMSFGENETCLTKEDANRWHSIFTQAAVNHVTVFASSGDQGAAQSTCDGAGWTQVVSSPASDPLVTAVGGTQLNAGGFCLAAFSCTASNYPYSVGQYIGETAWNEDLGNSWSTGGGFSKIFGKPFFQNNLVPGTARGLPDIAYNAGIYTGVLVEYEGAQFYRFGGTSAGSPQWAAITAIIDQKARTDLGVINPALYRLGDPSNASHCAACFQDITTGTNTVHEFNADGTLANVAGYNAGAGWDATTGIGSLNAANLSTALPHAVASNDTQAVISSTAQTKFNNGRTQSAGNKPH